MKEQLLQDGKAVGDRMSRVDGRLKVTGAATYSAEYALPNLVHAVLVGSTIAKGRIRSIDTKAAERAPGVLAVITHVNSPKVPGFAAKQNPDEPPTIGQPLRVFYDDKIYFNDQPIAVVVADTLERARYAAGLVKTQYAAEPHQTNFEANKARGFLPTQAKRNPKSPQNDYDRGQKDGYQSAPVKLEAEYVHESEMHNPMELQSIIAHWEAPDRLTVYDKVQAVKGTQRAFAKDWALPEENVKVIATFVGGAFGNGLHNWPHETAAIIAAKVTNRPVKLVLTREQMFTMVGYRPKTWQRVAMGATRDGKLVGITHECIGQTSSYEEFTESSVQQTRMMYAAPNVSTRYRILGLDISTPIWMRGPGEATGAFALESAIDEMAHLLNLDPLEFRLRNHTDTDPEKNKPWSTKYLKECFQAGAERIGWSKRRMQPGTLREGDWLVGYGMGVGTFGANRGVAKVRAVLRADGSVLLQSATTDIGPGTGTAMVQIAADALGLSPDKIRFELGNSTFPTAPSQGGSSTVNTVGSAVLAACTELKQKLQQLGGAAFAGAAPDQLTLAGGQLGLRTNAAAKASLADLRKQNNGQDIEVTTEAKPGDARQKYSMYSFSVHFAEVRVHALTGEVRVTKMVSCADAGTIVNQKTAGSQMIGGAIGGIGMALHEGALMDDRFGRYVTKDLADYHVPVHADAPPVEVFFVNKPDTLVDPIGTKGIGEIAIIGVAPAIANAIFNATGKRVRELPITPDKLI
ncbi:xanthine dehydrogenase family protein molybdopterin-binding subunit [Hymenobacter busanensis]|uniref:Xanthine dehydrogenase family protein molybdopterin-binding subunit n=1 Tax=Hymenobacter busanensis TaxID=2607656 RepID=A0A7L4ZV80_9BACT|nr:xanthine dehydrogenase family protein molybdopterin-binding subunit [Hymenobacter busanensis]KAA9327550.1 xanthine dehydrogenase family protein molybdopterin-binding subunit [Hymenobacter busanensis]QHJ06112.1 molybdopterin-dependent oxidoreductase [Hymenobacter busanensis]